jgi:hypothetical protein
MITNRFCQTIVAGFAIAKVQVVWHSDLTDMNTMIPLSYGASAAYPAGVALFDRDNRVLSRAAVSCV